MTDLYKRLAQRLDQLPNGFPSTESGIELKILKTLYTPDEAELALALKPTPETPAMMARRIGMRLNDLKPRLEGMAQKGLIGCFKLSGKLAYMLMPFLIGIYEFQVDRMDAEMAKLFAEYRPMLTKTVGGAEPAMTRVVPVNQSIEARHEVLRYEDLRGMVKEARSFVLKDCICRKQKAFEGEPCNHTMETCLGFSPEEGAYDDFTYAGRVIDKEGALELLDRVAEEGLVHCTYNVQEGQRFVCNCCICCCELLKSIKHHEAPYLLTGSHFAAVIDQETCEACGVCAEERCPMDAIVDLQVNRDRCIGCGVCIPTCPTGSITLERRSGMEPPANLQAWAMERMAHRSDVPRS